MSSPCTWSHIIPDVAIEVLQPRVSAGARRLPRRPGPVVEAARPRTPRLGLARTFAAVCTTCTLVILLDHLAMLQEGQSQAVVILPGVAQMVTSSRLAIQRAYTYKDVPAAV